MSRFFLTVIGGLAAALIVALTAACLVPAKDDEYIKPKKR